MSDILTDLRKAEARGLAPPQNWVSRAIEEIEYLRSPRRMPELSGNCPWCAALIYIGHAHICNTERTA